MKLVIENENKFRKAIFLGLFLASLLVLCLRSDAQATYQAYQNPKIQLFDNLGAIASGFKLCSFAAGTTTPLVTYADNAGTPNSNPIVLDGNGRAVVYTGASAYKFILYDASGNSSCPNSGVQLWSQDNVSNLAQLLPQKVASGTAAMTTAAIPAGSCGSLVTAAASGVATTDVIRWTFNTDPGTVAGLLTMKVYPTANNVNFAYCNPTAASQTPLAATINWAVVR